MPQAPPPPDFTINRPHFQSLLQFSQLVGCPLHFLRWSNLMIPGQTFGNHGCIIMIVTYCVWTSLAFDIAAVIMRKTNRVCGVWVPRLTRVCVLRLLCVKPLASCGLYSVIMNDTYVCFNRYNDLFDPSKYSNISWICMSNGKNGNSCTTFRFTFGQFVCLGCTLIVVSIKMDFSMIFSSEAVKITHKSLFHSFRFP